MGWAFLWGWTRLGLGPLLAVSTPESAERVSRYRDSRKCHKDGERALGVHVGLPRSFNLNYRRRAPFLYNLFVFLATC
jgi:hypothetical protein